MNLCRLIRIKGNENQPYASEAKGCTNEKLARAERRERIGALGRSNVAALKGGMAENIVQVKAYFELLLDIPEIHVGKKVGRRSIIVVVKQFIVPVQLPRTENNAGSQGMTII